MMNDSMTSEITTPYAQALMDIAKDANATDQVGQDVSDLLEILDDSSELSSFLTNPLITAEPKKGVLREIAEGKVTPFLLNFLLLLVDRGRVILLPDILKQYQALLRDLNQTVLANVTSAVELSDDQKNAICDRVKGLTGARNVELSVEVDPSLLGGLIIEVGSQVIDASLRGQLRRIGMQLSSAA